MYKHLIYMYKDTHVHSSSHFSPSCHEMHHMYSQRLYPIICLTKSDVCPKKLTHAGQIIWNAIIFFCAAIASRLAVAVCFTMVHFYISSKFRFSKLYEWKENIHFWYFYTKWVRFSTEILTVKHLNAKCTRFN